ncbi:hypothetical protein C8R45DRAFT_918083 [Mycena sanguinolenta]|nr:hypothetical protein C8R45DRAFT_918083 [Mycena sanguinolenta]
MSTIPETSLSLVSQSNPTSSPWTFTGILLAITIAAVALYYASPTRLTCVVVSALADVESTYLAAVENDIVGSDDVDVAERLAALQLTVSTLRSLSLCRSLSLSPLSFLSDMFNIRRSILVLRCLREISNESRLRDVASASDSRCQCPLANRTTISRRRREGRKLNLLAVNNISHPVRLKAQHRIIGIDLGSGRQVRWNEREPSGGEIWGLQMQNSSRFCASVYKTFVRNVVYVLCYTTTSPINLKVGDLLGVQSVYSLGPSVLLAPNLFEFLSTSFSAGRRESEVPSSKKYCTCVYGGNRHGNGRVGCVAQTGLGNGNSGTLVAGAKKRPFLVLKPHELFLIALPKTVLAVTVRGRVASIHARIVEARCNCWKVRDQLSGISFDGLGYRRHIVEMLLRALVAAMFTLAFQRSNGAPP